MRRSEAFTRLQVVRDEHEAARISLASTVRVLAADPRALPEALVARIGRAEFERCAENLPITYVIRLFSEFEAVLLNYWRRGLKRRSVPIATILINRISDLRQISPAHQTGAHAVREYRNEIVHEGLRTNRLTFNDCRSRLGRFLSWLPESW